MLVGASACGVPFDFTQEGGIAIPLGAAAGCVASGGGTIPANGEPDDGGNLVAWEYLRDGPRCTITASWTGPLIDMAAARTTVDQELSQRGLDPAHVDVEIVGFEPTVRMVELTDGDGGMSLPEGLLLNYQGSLDIGSVQTVIAFRFAPPGDPAQPSLDVSMPDELLSEINAAWDQRGVLPGRGETTVALSLEGTTPWDLAQLQVMIASYALHVSGRASPDLIGGDSE